MTITLVITEWLNAAVLSLTPVERWRAAGRFNDSFMTGRWLILIGVIAMIILAALFFVVSFNRTRRERKSTEHLFVEYAKQRGLSAREHQLLLNIANKAGLKRKESIFTLNSAFDHGTAKMTEEGLASQLTTEENKELKMELFFLREKLGFKNKSQTILSAASPGGSKKLSSAQIPVGKKLYLTRRKAHDSGNIEATVVKNDDMELSVELSTPVKITFGEFWWVRYYFGASVWEFDTSVVSYDGSVLVLNHSDDVRFINRRRFLRVPVKRPAFIAHFPFTRILTNKSDSSKEGFEDVQNLAKILTDNWGPPEFVPAVVTELAGPGLRIEALLEVEIGDRVLVMFRLDEDEEGDHSSISADEADKTYDGKIAEDIGVVRHIKAGQNGLSIAVELTGLKDSDINRLIQATNAASLKASLKDEDVADSPGTEGSDVEPVSLQGV